jgi:Transposase
MQRVTTIGLDIAKSVFQVHGVDAIGNVVIRRQLKRRYVLAFFQKLAPCVVGIEACATSHHWSRELKVCGHTVRLMPPAYVKPYVKRQKNDAADAEAICEAVTRANMRFVATKTPEQQSGLMLHRTARLVGSVPGHDLAALGAQLRMLKAQILEFDRGRHIKGRSQIALQHLKLATIFKTDNIVRRHGVLNRYNRHRKLCRWSLDSQLSGNHRGHFRRSATPSSSHNQATS